MARTTCPVCRARLVCYCPKCRGRAGGRVKSEAKTAAVRENAKKPRKRPPEPE